MEQRRSFITKVYTAVQLRVILIMNLQSTYYTHTSIAYKFNGPYITLFEAIHRNFQGLYMDILTLHYDYGPVFLV